MEPFNADHGLTGQKDKRSIKMKKALFAIAVASLVGLASPNLMAWGGGPGWGGCYGPGNGPGYGRGYGYENRGGRALYNLEFLKEEIGLSDEQIQKIIKIDADYRAKYFTNRNDYAKINQLRTDHRKELENVLTNDQKKKLDEYYNDRDTRRNYRNGPRS